MKAREGRQHRVGVGHPPGILDETQGIAVRVGTDGTEIPGAEAKPMSTLERDDGGGGFISIMGRSMTPLARLLSRSAVAGADLVPRVYRGPVRTARP